MTFSHDTEQALGTLVRLVNTMPGPNSQVDSLETLEELEKFVQEREFSAVDSLSDKLGISRRACRRILEQLVEQGVVQRRDFVDMAPIYLRFPSR